MFESGIETETTLDVRVGHAANNHVRCTIGHALDVEDDAAEISTLR